MRKTILQTFWIAVVLSWTGSITDVPASLTAGIASEIMTVESRAESIGSPPPGLVREVTAYNVGVREQTNSEPCIGASGINLCRLITQGQKICAANFVDLKTVLHIDGYGECLVLDRMNRRFPHRVDIAMGEEEIEKALEFGIQRLYVEIRT